MELMDKPLKKIIYIGIVLHAFINQGMYLKYIFETKKIKSIYKFPVSAAEFLPMEQNPVIEFSPVNLICKSFDLKPIFFCHIYVTGLGTPIKINMYTISNGRYKVINKELDNGLCGVRLLSANVTNTGPVSCTLNLGEDAEYVEETAYTTLKVQPHTKVLTRSPNGGMETKN